MFAVLDKITVAFFEPSELRDSAGRWAATDSSHVGLLAAVNAKANADLAKSFLPPDQAALYGDAIHEVVNSIPPGCLQRITHYVKEYAFHSSIQTLKTAYIKTGGQPTRKIIGGFWEVHPGGSQGVVHIDGGKDTGEDYSNTIRHVYAHELAHAVDGPNVSLSNQLAWKKAWASEIDFLRSPITRYPTNPSDVKLTAYATTSVEEGFAEFGRLVFMEPETARDKFPQCWAFWKSISLV